MADRARRPLRIVRQKRHLAPLSVDFDDGADAPERLGVFLRSVRRRQLHCLVGDDVAGCLAAFDDPAEHVDFLPENPEYVPRCKIVQKGEIDIRPIRKQDVSAFHVLRELVRHRGVVRPARLDAYDGRDERAHGQPRVHLCRRFLAPVGIAGYAGERELYNRRVDCEDAAIPEAREESPDPFRRNEVGRNFTKMPDGFPVHLFGDFGGPRPVRV